MGNLLDAVSQSRVLRVKKLIAKGADVNKEDLYFGVTPLMRVRNAETAQVLLDAGADVHFKDKKGRTPLGEARNEQIAQLLIAAGAELTPETELFLSCRFGQTDKVKALIAAGVNVNAVYGNEFTPLHYAANAPIVRALIDAGADVNAKDHLNQVPLTHAILRHDYESVQMLLDAGADVNAVWSVPARYRLITKNALNSTQDPKMLKLLLDAGAKP